MKILTFLLLSLVSLAAATNINIPPCCTKPLTENSIYQLTSTWTNDSAKALKLASLRGKPQVVTMFFAQCHTACPILVHDLRRIEAALPEKVRSQVNFALVSFDTERDTPEALATFRKNNKLPDTWNLLTGGKDDVLELAALLGVKYRKEPTGQFAHSNIITVLDAEGEVIMQQVGLNRDPAPAVAALSALFK